MVWDSRVDTFDWKYSEAGWLSFLLDLPVLLRQIGEDEAAAESERRADEYLAENARLVAELEALSAYEDGYVRARVFWAQFNMAYKAYFNPNDFESTWASFNEARVMLAKLEESAREQAALEADLRLIEELNAPRITDWIDPKNPDPEFFQIPSIEEVRAILKANPHYVPAGIKRRVQIRLRTYQGDTYLLPVKGKMDPGDFFLWKEWWRRGRKWYTYLFDGHQTVELY